MHSGTDPFLFWRRERDSNPRWSFPHTPLAGERLQPLGHLSESCNRRSITDSKVHENSSFEIVLYKQCYN